MNDRNKFQIEGLKWLQEMELVNHPQFINNLKLNILMVSPRIKEVEFLIYREQKAILIYIELSWLGRKFFKRQILTDVSEMVSQIIPSFRFRITEDPEIMNLSITKVQNAITGGTNNESTNTTISKPTAIVSESKVEQLNEVKPASEASSKPDTEE